MSWKSSSAARARSAVLLFSGPMGMAVATSGWRPPPTTSRPWGRSWPGGWRGPPGARRPRSPRYKKGWGWVTWLAISGAALLLVTMVGWLGVSRWVDRRLYPQVLQLAESRLQAVATEKVSQTLLSVLQGRGYQTVMRVATAQDGAVSYLALDAMAAGRLEMEAAVRIQQAFNDLRDVSVEVPLGESSGIRLLGAWGPRLRVRLLPVGNIIVGLRSTFQEAGINQTLHQLSLTVQATMRLVLPRAEQEVRWSFAQPLGETLVVGKVPEVYASVAGQGLVTTLPLGAGAIPGQM